MADGALRGTRLGALSYETDEGVHFAERQAVYYDCSCGTTIELPFSMEAEMPAVWECRCGAEALLRGADWPEKKPQKPQRTICQLLSKNMRADAWDPAEASRLEIMIQSYNM